MTAPAFDALDLLLALRDEDLSDAERAAASSIEGRAEIEAEDSLLAAMIDDWVADEITPSFTASDIFALAANDDASPAADVFPESSDSVERPASIAAGHAGPTTGGSLPPWLVPVALAASIAALAFGAWQMSDTPAETEDMRPKSMVSDASATRVALQFSVEGTAGVLPGRNGASYGPDDSLAFRFDVAGDAGYMALLEVNADGDWDVLYPLDGGTLAVEEGAHVLASDSGAPLVYRPDEVEAGTLDYVAVVLSEPVDPARVVPGLLAAGLHRADLWPRPVVAVDAVTVTWEAR
ncbi:MAG: hypothetical protein KDA24_01285 [Deltaproteobacteria bacterium]|nr:hypothetical protein [Deltaproteobacteria bacterium]